MLGVLVEPDSATGVARRLGMPRQRANYHLKQLEAAGLVEFVEERRRGNCNERIVQATAASYIIDPALLGVLGPEPERIADRFSSAYLLAMFASAIREIAELRRRADEAGKPIATLGAMVDIRFKDAASRAACGEELASMMARLAAKYHDAAAEGGRLHRVCAGVWPAVTKMERSVESA